MKGIESRSDNLRLIASRGKDTSGGSEFFFDEPDFNEMFNRERKRSQRSMKPLILMLLDISNLKKPNFDTARSKLPKAIAKGIRDTDVRGWYKRGSVVGILFTDLESASPTVREILFRRIMAGLVNQIDPGALFKIKVSFLMYPESMTHGDAVDRFDMKYHKDLVKKPGLFSLSAKMKSLVDVASNFLMT